VSRLVGEREFWSLPFAVTPATLDPRPDSETLVEAALARTADRAAPVRLLDLGTGSGCLLLALLHELRAAWGVGTDRSAAAVAAARANAVRLGLADRARFVVADWAAPLAGRFDIVLANPPYIERGAIAGLAPEVARHDPVLALDGGPDGLDAYRAILAGLEALVAPRGRAYLEIGDGQAGAVSALLEAAGFADLELAHDLAGRARCLVACKNP
jgi:release factor glutamine methyltransferase